MNYQTIRNIVEQYFDPAWKLMQPSVPVGYQNISFTEPNESAWLKLGFQPAGSFRLSINGCYEYRGLVVLQVYTPLKTGMSGNEMLVDDIIEIFTSANLSVMFDDITVSFVGEIGQRFNLTNVFIDYRAT